MLYDETVRGVSWSVKAVLMIDRPFKGFRWSIEADADHQEPPAFIKYLSDPGDPEWIPWVHGATRIGIEVAQAFMNERRANRAFHPTGLNHRFARLADSSELNLELGKIVEEQIVVG